MKFSDIVIDVEDDPTGKVRVAPDGRHHSDAKVTLTPTGMKMMMEGYICGNCFEDFTRSGIGAFPEACPLCSFEVRALQAQQIAYGFVGAEKIGSRISLSDELEALAERTVTPSG